jgi:carbon-monoxide dehydrogenase iron sulfur subunit
MLRQCLPSSGKWLVEAKTSNLWEDVVPRVDPTRCRRCPDCPPMATCPAQGFRRSEPDSIPVADEDFCFGCYSCADACPHGAIILPRTHR